MFITILILISSLALLIFSGHGLVRGSVSIASKFHISSLVIGMTVVAFGTSAPELIVSLRAAMEGHPDIAVGNVVGSNIANVALVLGLTAMVIALPVVSKRLFYDWFFMMISYFFLWLFFQNGVIDRYQGVLMVVAIVLFTWRAIKTSMARETSDKDEVSKTYPVWLAIIIILASCAGLAWGADLLVNSASEIALAFGVSERVISVTIVAFGTSVPELTASLVAAFKKETEISVGNIVGSNLFNILVVLGVTSVIHPIPVNYIAFRTDLLWMAVLGILLMLVIYPFRVNLATWKSNRQIKILTDLRNGRLTFWGGLILFVLYIVYIAMLF
ncbi:calcium/sodium antiporter [Saccharicrinis sp. FJH54]|uniref:calcium/sodium antiporter n=1 Tax=Saccharicrinis sp. FJH54 TaxID=3344665 RepID=UPI0035D43399